MVSQTEYILYKKLDWSYLTTFTFAATLCIYAVHRLVGMKKVKEFQEKYRYHIIEKYRSHILLYALLGGIVSTYYFFQLTTFNQLLIIIPGFIAVGYVLPFFGKQRRLRDFNYVKIFLVAIVWAFITVVLPIIPFDIRDLQVDKHIAVKTIPAVIGEKRSKLLAVSLLVIAGLLASCLWFVGSYSTSNFMAILCTYFLTSILIYLSNMEQHDYFFTGFLDGTMILQFTLVLVFSSLS